MGINFTPQESYALYELLTEQVSDLVLKTDRDGFILHASPDDARHGFLLSGELTGRHLRDLVEPSHADPIEAKHQAVIEGRGDCSWLEIQARAAGDRAPWFEVRMRALAEGDQIYGAVSIVRSIAERRAFEDKLFTAAMTDPLTGLTNRTAFVSMLQHIVDRRTGGCLAIFAIDYFKAMNMQYGQAFGDEVLVLFAGLLRDLMRSEDMISRIGGDSIGVLLPRTNPEQAQAICRRVIATLSDIRQAAGGDGVSITASVGVSRIRGTLDATIKRAELALFLAKAKGRDRLEMDDGRRLPRVSGW